MRSRYYYVPPRETKLSKALTVVCCIVLALLFIVMLFMLWGMDTAQWPEIASVEVVDSHPISYQELKAKNTGNCLDIFESQAEYKFKVTMDDGKEYYVTGNGLNGTPVNSFRGSLFVDATVSEQDCKYNLSQGIDTVEVRVCVRFVKRAKRPLTDTEIDRFETTVKKELKNCTVESVKHISDKPLEIYYDSNFYDFSGELFEVTYGDGKKVTVPAQMEREEGSVPYMEIDGNKVELYPSDETGVFEIWCFDSISKVRVTTRSFPFESFEITDCVFNEEYKPVKVSYTITKTNKEVITGTSSVHSIGESSYILEDTFYGYCMYLRPEIVYPGLFVDVEINLTATLGAYSTRELTHTGVFAPPETDCDCICHNNKAIVKKYNNFVCSIEKLFSIDKVCECGAVHYEKD